MKRFLAILLFACLLFPAVVQADVEVLVRLQDGPGGRRAGDIIAVQDVVPGVGWGLGQKPPHYAVVAIKGVTAKDLEAYHKRHYEYEAGVDRQPGKTVRSKYRLNKDLLPAADKTTLGTGTLTQTVEKVLPVLVDRTTPAELSASRWIERKIELSQAWRRLLAWLPPTKARATTTFTKIVDPDNGGGTHYISLDAWEDALGGTTNGDLVTNDQIAIAQCRNSAGSADTALVQIAGWTTGLSNDIRITTYTGYAHSGVWDETKYYLHNNNGNGYIINIEEEYVSFSNLQVKLTESGTNDNGAFYCTSGTAPVLYFSNLIIRGVCSGTGGSSVFGLGGALTAYISNCIIYDIVSGADSGFRAIGVYSGTNPVNVINCTIYNCYFGLFRSGGVLVVTNTISFGNVDDFNGTITIDYCASDDGDGTHAVAAPNWATVFINPNYATSKDFRIVIGGPCDDAGTNDPSGLGYGNPDIAGTAREGTWDIGAFEAGAAASGGKKLLRFVFFEG